MKVALLGIEGDFSNSVGAGIQRYMYELYNHMNLIEKNEIDVKKIEIKKFPVIGNGLSFYVGTLLLNLSEFNILHNLMPVPFGKPEFLRNNILITTAHDFQPILYPQFTFDHNFSIKDRLWLYLVIRNGYISTLKSDYILANSTQTRDEAAKLGYEKSRVYIVPHGIDERFAKGKTNIKNRGRIFKVGYLGALRKRKNVEFAVKALNKVSDKTITFDIWGKKEFEYTYLKSLVKNKNTRFLGFAPERDLIKIYDSFDAFVFPSFHEGEGLPILEAQARGLPVIIYKYGKIPKEVRKYCFEAESPEHMAQIIEELKENGYNEKLRKKAMEYARSFTWERTAKETLKVYKKIMSMN